MTFDPTISTGSILNILTCLGAVALGFWRIATRLTKIEMKLNLVWRWFEREHKINGSEKEE